MGPEDNTDSQFKTKPHTRLSWKQIEKIDRKSASVVGLTSAMVRHRPDAFWTMVPPVPEVFVKPTVKADEAAVQESSTVVAPAVVALFLVPRQNGVLACASSFWGGFQPPLSSCRKPTGFS